MLEILVWENADTSLDDIDDAPKNIRNHWLRIVRLELNHNQLPFLMQKNKVYYRLHLCPL